MFHKSKISRKHPTFFLFQQYQFRRTTFIIDTFSLLTFSLISADCLRDQTVHIRRRTAIGRGEGSKIGQICRHKVVKKEGRAQKSRKICQRLKDHVV